MRLNYRRVGAGEPLVLIHGIGSRLQVWDPVVPLLQADRDVIALDLPGFAASPPPPPGTPAGVASLTRFVSEFIDELGLERPHVGGNSLGGWLALELAKLGRARSATALSPAGFYSDGEARFARTSLSIVVRIGRLTASRAESLVATPLLRRLTMGQYFYRPERLSPAQAAATFRALAGAPWFDETLAAIASDRFTDGAEIDVPVTIAWGEHDRLLLRRQAARAARAIPSTRSITLYGCGHVPTYDYPEQVAQVLLEGSADG